MDGRRCSKLAPGATLIRGDIMPPRPATPRPRGDEDACWTNVPRGLHDLKIHLSILRKIFGTTSNYADSNLWICFRCQLFNVQLHMFREEQWIHYFLDRSPKTAFQRYSGPNPLRHSWRAGGCLYSPSDSANTNNNHPLARLLKAPPFEGPFPWEAS